MIFRDAPLIVWGATVVHIIIGAMVLFDPAAARSTGPAKVSELFGVTPAGLVMLGASALAIFAIVRQHADDWAIVLFLLPQQLLLYIAAWGGLEAVLNGE